MLKLRFDTGRVFLGGNTYQTIDGWVIAFTPLSFLTCLNATTGDLAAAAKTEDTEQNVVFRSSNPTKLCPGEYSIHRIFAAIAGETLFENCRGHNSLIYLNQISTGALSFGTVRISRRPMDKSYLSKIGLKIRPTTLYTVRYNNV